MKNLIVFLFLAISITCSAQRNFKIGVRASVGPSWFGNSSEEFTKGYAYWTEGSSKTSFSVGLTSEIKMVGILYLQPEVSFVQTQSTFAMAFTNIDSKGKEFTDYIFYDHPIKLNQVSIPVFAKIKLGRLNLMAGPSYSVLFKNNGYYQTDNEGNPVNVTSFSTNDVALNTGVSFEFFKKPSINLDIRHYRGFRHFDSNLYGGSVGYRQTYLHAGVSVLF